jgi:hypothetical protein
MKKILSLALIAILLILSLLALDDITTGNEPNYYLEYAFLAVSIIIIFIIVFRLKRK